MKDHAPLNRREFLATAARAGLASAAAPVYISEVAPPESRGRLVSFFESTNFNEMAPHDELKNGGTQYVLAAPGDSYIAYASALSGFVGDRYVFAVLQNGFPVSWAWARTAQDRFAAALAASE